MLFIDKKPVCVIEAKPENWGQKITVVEEQSGGYAAVKLKWLNSESPLPFIYEGRVVVTRFTDSRDPKPRVRRGLQLPPTGDYAGVAEAACISSPQASRSARA